MTNPVPVACVPLAVLHPPLVGNGWIATAGCCTTAAYHRDTALGYNGDLQTGEVFAIDFEQIGPNNSCCNGPPEAVSSWWAYGTPVLAAADGVVVEEVNDMPDQSPVGTLSKNISDANATGNHVIEDIGNGHYVYYAHFMPGSIPKGVVKGAKLTAGEQIGRVGNSGNSGAPHLHFDVRDRPTNTDATGLPFVFDTQLREGRVSEADLETKGKFESGFPITIDRTGAGFRTDLMPARNDVFGFNLAR